MQIKTVNAKMFKSVREGYATEGVEKYYVSHGETYVNPHEHYIDALLIKNKNRIDYSKILDLCCGSGEVTGLLQALGYKNMLGCDPFTARLYREKTGCDCLEYSFTDFLLPQTLTDTNFETKFSAIICSFALHLASEKILYSLVETLWQLSDAIVIITPHKRPALENLQHTQLFFEDFVLTERGKKIFLKCYNRK